MTAHKANGPVQKPRLTENAHRLKGLVALFAKRFNGIPPLVDFFYHLVEHGRSLQLLKIRKRNADKIRRFFLA